MLLTNLCPCCSNLLYVECCGRFLEHGAYPPNAELLMRSRYTAYTQKNYTYLRKTWHPDFYPLLDENDLETTQWLSLIILKTKLGHKKSVVEFKAFYLAEGKEVCLHEISVFKKIKNRWVYVNAENF